MNIQSLLDNIGIIYKRIEMIENIPIQEENEMLLNKEVKLKNTPMPIIPILWYREQEAVCSVEFKQLVTREYVKNTYNYNIPTDIKLGPFLIQQSHICYGRNIYITNHSLLYYMMHKSQFEKVDTVKIPNIAINKNFEVQIVPLNNSKIITVNDGLKINQYVSGSVHIHHEKYSPTGTLHFKVDETVDQNEFICLIKNNELDISMACLYILINDEQPLYC